MLYLDNFSFSSTNQRCRMVTITKVIAYRICTLFHQRLTYYRLCIHSHQCRHTIATMNVKGLCYRTKSVSSIHITTMSHIIIQTPS